MEPSQVEGRQGGRGGLGGKARLRQGEGGDSPVWEKKKEATGKDFPPWGQQEEGAGERRKELRGNSVAEAAREGGCTGTKGLMAAPG